MFYLIFMGVISISITFSRHGAGVLLVIVSNELIWTSKVLLWLVYILYNDNISYSLSDFPMGELEAIRHGEEWTNKQTIIVIINPISIKQVSHIAIIIADSDDSVIMLILFTWYLSLIRIYSAIWEITFRVAGILWNVIRIAIFLASIIFKELYWIHSMRALSNGNTKTLLLGFNLINMYNRSREMKVYNWHRNQ